MTGGKGKLVQKQTDELELLIATAREERSAISAMLTTLTSAQREADAARQDARAGRPRRRRASPTRLDEIAKRLDGARRSHEGARGGRQAHPGAEGRRQAGGADDAEGDRPRRRAAEASRSGAAPVVAGAPDAGDARHAEEGARDARGAARPAAQGGRRSEAVARPAGALKSELDQIRATATTLHAGLRQDPRDLARSARGHDRRDDDGQGSREEARTARAAPRAEPEHRGAPRPRSTRSPSTCRTRPRRSRASSRRSSTPSSRPIASTRWSGRWTCRSAS